ncbi:MAG: hypothetical protein IK092_04645 [Muribaculaceae bacterium]|nr:hypothetical protein [Muribaculaceae bacterium]
MAKKDEKKNEKKNNNIKTTIGETIQGRTFLSFDFFKRHWVYVMALTVMLLMYISNKYVYQDSQRQVIKLTTDLNNAKTDQVKSSATYNSMIRESQMEIFLSKQNLDLKAPEQPAYVLK